MHWIWQIRSNYMLMIYHFHWYPPSPFAQTGAWHFQWIQRHLTGLMVFRCILWEMLHHWNKRGTVPSSCNSWVSAGAAQFWQICFNGKAGHDLILMLINVRIPLLGTSISHLGKTEKSSSKVLFLMGYVSSLEGISGIWTGLFLDMSDLRFGDFLRGKGFGKRDSHVSLEHLKWALNITCCFLLYKLDQWQHHAVCVCDISIT